MTSIIFFKAPQASPGAWWSVTKSNRSVQSNNARFNGEPEPEEGIDIVLNFFGQLPDLKTAGASVVDQNERMVGMDSGITLAHAFPTSALNQPGGGKFHRRSPFIRRT